MDSFDALCENDRSSRPFDQSRSGRRLIKKVLPHSSEKQDNYVRGTLTDPFLKEAPLENSPCCRVRSRNKFSNRVNNSLELAQQPLKSSVFAQLSRQNIVLKEPALEEQPLSFQLPLPSARFKPPIERKCKNRIMDTDVPVRTPRDFQLFVS